VEEVLRSHDVEAANSAQEGEHEQRDIEVNCEHNDGAVDNQMAVRGYGVEQRPEIKPLVDQELGCIARLLEKFLDVDLAVTIFHHELSTLDFGPRLFLLLYVAAIFLKEAFV